jgi:hypothetical protein
MKHEELAERLWRFAATSTIFDFQFSLFNAAFQLYDTS